MNSLRMICSTFIDWLAQSIRFLPKSASSTLAISPMVCVVGVVDICSVPELKDAVAVRGRNRHSKEGWAARNQVAHHRLLCDGGFVYSSLLAQSGRLIRGFPGKVGFVTPEMAVSSRLAVNRTAQVE